MKLPKELLAGVKGHPTLSTTDLSKPTNINVIRWNGSEAEKFYKDLMLEFQITRSAEEYNKRHNRQ